MKKLKYPYPTKTHRGVQYYIVPATKDPDGGPSGCEGCHFHDPDDEEFFCPHDEKRSRHKRCCGDGGPLYHSWWIPKTEEAVTEYIATFLTS